MSFSKTFSCSHETRQNVPQGVPSAGSPEGVTEGRGEICRVSDPHRLTFFEAEQLAREQIGLSTLYVEPPKPTDADSYRLWRMYIESVKLAEALCTTMAEVYRFGDDKIIRVDGEEIEAETVKAIFSRLTGDHICKVIKAIRLVKDADRKQAMLNRRYFRAALYNAVFELEAQAQAGMDRPTDGWQ